MISQGPSLLPNTRLLCLPSERLGEDWYELSLEIDGRLPLEGLELSEESVYLLFDRSPAAVSVGEGSCLVARPVTGPKVKVAQPFVLLDWVRISAYPLGLHSSAWPKLLAEASEQWEGLHREGKNLKGPFAICLRRRLEPELRLDAQAIYTE